jgi:hypothetical protein
MIVRSPPEVSFEAANRVAGGGSQAAEAGDQHPAGPEKWTFKSAPSPGKAEPGDPDNLSKLAAVLNNLAWDFQDKDRSLEAQAAARLAVHFEPSVPDYLDTLAEMLYQAEQFKGVLKYKETAAQIDPKFEADIDKYRQAANVANSS